jgi:hypothetical protein
MWVKKTQDEIENEPVENIDKWNIKTPLIIALIASFAILLWEQTVIIFFSTFVVSFFLSYFGQVFFGDPLFFVSWAFTGFPTSSKEEMGICNKCHKFHTDSPGTKCNCGGKIEPRENWKWIDD